MRVHRAVPALLIVGCSAMNGGARDGADAGPLRRDAATVLADAGVHDAATALVDAGVRDGATLLADAGGHDAAASALCTPGASVTPVGNANVRYTQWRTFPCYEKSCLCTAPGPSVLRDILACDSVQGGFYWRFGTVVLRPSAIAEGACVLEIGREAEGYLEIRRCTLPLPIAAWPGLSANDGAIFSGIEDRCESADGCYVHDIAPECRTRDPAPPLCPPGALSCG